MQGTGEEMQIHKIQELTLQFSHLHCKKKNKMIYVKRLAYESSIVSKRKTGLSGKAMTAGGGTIHCKYW